MSETKEFTYSDVSEHTSKKDLYVVIHDKVYNASSFVDEHPYVHTTHPKDCPLPPAELSVLCQFADEDMFAAAEKKSCSM
jgi:hypothetical protein